MLNTTLYKNCFSTDEMRGIWSEKETVSLWLHVEKTLASVQAEMDLIPTDAANALNKVSPDTIDIDLLAEEMELVGRPIVGFVRQLRECVGPEHDRFIHHGTTTQDIMDTATVLQMRDGLECICNALERIVSELEALAEKHTGTTMIGRTNGQWAEPITFGSKAGLWAAELRRRLESIESGAKRGIQLQLGGPVGNLNSFCKTTGSKLRKRVARKLKLTVQESIWQNRREGLGDIVLALGQLGTSVGKICHNVNLLSSSDIGELYETPVSGKGASSAMAHKRNQRSSEFGEALGRLVRGRAMQIGETAMVEHERSGGVWIAEWVIIPEVFMLTSGALHWLETLFATLEVNTEKMADNLKLAKQQVRDRLHKEIGEE